MNERSSGDLDLRSKMKPSHSIGCHKFNVSVGLSTFHYLRGCVIMKSDHKKPTYVSGKGSLLHQDEHWKEVDL